MKGSLSDRAALAVSGARLTQQIHIMVDPKALAACETLGILVRKSRKHGMNQYHPGTGVSQFVYYAMVEAIQKELKIKGLV